MEKQDLELARLLGLDDDSAPDNAIQEKPGHSESKQLVTELELETPVMKKVKEAVLKGLARSPLGRSFNPQNIDMSASYDEDQVGAHFWIYVDHNLSPEDALAKVPVLKDQLEGVLHPMDTGLIDQFEGEHTTYSLKISHVTSTFLLEAGAYFQQRYDDVESEAVSMGHEMVQMRDKIKAILNAPVQSSVSATGFSVEAAAKKKKKVKAKKALSKKQLAEKARKKRPTWSAKHPAHKLNRNKFKISAAQYPELARALSAYMNEDLQAYLEAALWSSLDDNDQPFDQNYDFGDIAPETIEQSKQDLHDFIQKAMAQGLIGEDDDVMAQLGHDFWLSRNHHGSGFFDGDWGQHGDALQALAGEFKELSPMLGGDGKIYFEG